LQANPQPFELRNLVGEVIEALRPNATAKELILAAVYASDVPDWISADAQRVRQILTNIVGNALKFTVSGSVQVRVETLEERPQWLRFEVTDTGHGITGDQLQRIFERFAQADESNTRHFGGAGLGLAISKGLVEMMGGDIGVKSEVGRGSTFWFAMPAPAAVEQVAEASANESTGDLSHLRILIADDVEQNRELIGVILSPFGVVVAQAADGQEAVEIANRERFDIILMDIQMPRLDGRAATKAIRASSPYNKATPIVALSADVLPEHIEACEAAGMNDHMAKPIDIQNLLSTIAFWTAGPQSDDGGFC
jgi:CheY-like chemotaxis protein